jgi:hypothetical protein
MNDANDQAGIGAVINELAGPSSKPDPGHRVLTNEEKARMAAIKDKGAELLDLISAAGSSRELSIAKTKTEEAVMWAVKHITA